MKNLKRFVWGWAILAGITAYIAILFGSNLDITFLWLLLPAAAFGIISVYLLKKLGRLQLIHDLRLQWGRRQGPDKKRDFVRIATLFAAAGPRTKGFAIDHRTWQDLDMDLVFAQLDRTLTGYGQQCLYQILRSPEFNREKLTFRAQLIGMFQRDAKIRETFQVFFSKIGPDGGVGAANLLWDPPAIWQWDFNWLFKFMFAAAVFSPLVFFHSLAAGILAVNAIFILNSLIYYTVQKRISVYFTGVKSLGRLLHWGQKICQIEAPELDPIQIQLKPAFQQVAAYKRATSLIGLDSSQDPISGALMQYISIFFLTEIRSFYRALDLIQKNRSRFQEIFLTVGDLDACQAVASYRESLPYYCEPDLTDRDSGAGSLVGQDMYHPLLKDPVANSLTITGKGVLLTGSNMSGKTTFLRSLGLNSLFAQTLYTCFARHYKAEYVKLLTVIGRSDNIIEGKSYYLEEAQSILRVIQEADQSPGQAVLAIFDEMYRGTNAEERIRAGYSVLKYMVHKGNFVLAATHDLDLATMLAQFFDNYHFREQVADHGLDFDYILKPGVSTTKNAIKLLQILGYPEEITGAGFSGGKVN